LLDVAGVDEHQREAVFEDRPDRLPVDPRRLHHDIADAVRLKPVAQHQKPAHRGLELLDVLDPLAVRARHPHAGGHLGLMHVKRALAFDHHLHLDLPLRNDGPSPARNLGNRRV